MENQHVLISCHLDCVQEKEKLVIGRFFMCLNEIEFDDGGYVMCGVGEGELMVWS